MRKLIILALGGAALMGALPAIGHAEDPSRLITADPSNHSADPATVKQIAKLLGERSDSSLVRARADQVDGRGVLVLSTDEILADIGAGKAGPVAATTPAPATVVATPVATPVATQQRVSAVPRLSPLWTPREEREGSSGGGGGGGGGSGGGGGGHSGGGGGGGWGG